MPQEVFYETKPTLSSEELAAVRASPTALCWKRAADLPKELRVEEGVCSNRQGRDLWYSAVFPPADKPLRGVVLYLHGVNEHSGRFMHLFEELCAMDFGVVAYDLRSHGKTYMDVPKLRGHIDKFESLVDDTNDFISFVKETVYAKMHVGMDSPFVICGYSMGSLVAMHTVLSEQHKIDAIVLCAPLVAIEMTPVLWAYSFIGGLVALLAPTARAFPGVNEEWVCRDPLVGTDYEADPLAVSGLLTSRTGRVLGNAMDQIVKNKSFEEPDTAFTRVPVLFIQGTLDKVVSIPMAKLLFNRLANKDKQFIDINGCYHVLFEDFERPRVISEIKQWLQKRFPPLP